MVESTDYQADLEERFLDMVDRSATARDSIVKLRQLLREQREHNVVFKARIAELEAELLRKAAYHEAFVAGEQSLFNTVLDRLVR